MEAHGGVRGSGDEPGSGWERARIKGALIDFRDWEVRCCPNGRANLLCEDPGGSLLGRVRSCVALRRVLCSIGAGSWVFTVVDCPDRYHRRACRRWAECACAHDEILRRGKGQDRQFPTESSDDIHGCEDSGGVGKRFPFWPGSLPDPAAPGPLELIAPCRTQENCIEWDRMPSRTLSSLSMRPESRAWREGPVRHPEVKGS
jgi:hypothetical protein